MRTAPPRHDEDESLASLRSLDVLDSGPEPVFDAIVKAAALVCGTPISLLTLLDTERQWFKANHGLPGVSETPRDVAFCAHAVLDADLMEVGDTTLDDRFCDSPLVTQSPSVRFYAGIPLRLRDGSRIGTLCVIDRVPRRLTDEQKAVLTHLGEAAAHALEGRRAMNTLQEAALEISRSEAILGLERRRLANVIEGANVGVWDLNVSTGEAKVNARWAEIRGTSLDALEPQSLHTWFDQFHPDDVDRARALFEQHLRGETPRYECEARVRRSDGTWRWIIDRGRVMTRRADGAAEWIVGARLDIDPRKQREELMRLSREFLDRTGKVAGVGGWQLDPAIDKLSWSDETFRIHGLPVGLEPRLDEALDFYAPEARPVIRAAFERATASGDGWDLELPFLRSDGAKIWARVVGSAERVDGKVVRLVGALQDVTATVEERLELERANTRVQVATESGGIGIWEYDLVDRALVWDRLMYRIYGLPPGERLVTMKDWQRLLSEGSLELIRAAMDDAASGKREFDLEFDIRWPDGRARTVRAAARVLRDESNRATRIIGATWDVTESRLVAAELRRQSVIAALQAGVAVAANQATSLDEALQACIDLVCNHTGWPVGHVYLRSAEDRDLWVPGEAWSRSSFDGYAAFKDETAATGFTFGSDLVGTAARDRRPVIFDDLQLPAFGRTRSARAAGLRRGVAAPVVVGEEVVAVLEFYAKATRDFDQSLVELVAYTGTQIGRVVDRERARKALELRSAELREKSIVDELTGLYNRRGFLELSAERLGVARKSGQRVFLLFADLDGMKLINDELGHDAGDAALVATAVILRRTLRVADLVARLGGDEFVALVCATGTFGGEALIGRLEAAVTETNSTGRLPFPLGVSFGVTGPAEDGEDIAALLKRADAAMYERKNARRSRR